VKFSFVFSNISFTCTLYFNSVKTYINKRVLTCVDECSCNVVALLAKSESVMYEIEKYDAVFYGSANPQSALEKLRKRKLKASQPTYEPVRRLRHESTKYIVCNFINSHLRRRLLH